jgi:eukaryotic-like serine/threonine-protein kinase
MQLTGAGFTLGTPYYMAPEQVLGKPLTPQADVYAFGILLFELMVGSKPVNGDTVEKIFQQILYEPLNLEPLARLDTPPRLIELIARCTAKHLAQRPQNLTAVGDELQTMLDASRELAQNVRAAPPLPAPLPDVRPLLAFPAAAQPRSPHPAFLNLLPAPLQTQGGLILVSAAAVLVVAGVVLAIMAAARVI